MTAAMIRRDGPRGRQGSSLLFGGVCMVLGGLLLAERISLSKVLFPLRGPRWPRGFRGGILRFALENSFLGRKKTRAIAEASENEPGDCAHV